MIYIFLALLFFACAAYDISMLLISKTFDLIKHLILLLPLIILSYVVYLGFVR